MIKVFVHRHQSTAETVELVDAQRRPNYTARATRLPLGKPLHHSSKIAASTPPVAKGLQRRGGRRGTHQRAHHSILGFKLQ